MEMRELGEIETIHLVTVMNAGLLRKSVRIEVEVIAFHRFIFTIVEDDDEQGKLVVFRGAERSKGRIVEERTIAGERDHRPVACRKLYAQSHAERLAQARGRSEEALRLRPMQMGLHHIAVDD